jgi:aromatic-L-amino-acid decarboxylase
MDDEDKLAAHNLDLVHRINRSGRFYLTPAVLKGVQMVRVSIGSEASEFGHVEALWAALRQAADAR